MSRDGSSNVRVFISWHDQTVFAGEDVKCTIIFKNVAPTPTTQKHTSSRQSNLDRSRHGPLQVRGKANNPGLTPPPSASRGHRSGLSLGVPSANSRGRTGSVTWSPPPASPNDGRQGDGHKRSISIVSIGSAGTADAQSESNASSARTGRYVRGHTRASSLQILPRPSGPGQSGPSSASQALRNVISPASNAHGWQGRTSGASTVPSTPSIVNPLASPRSASASLSEFRFPSVQSPLAEVHNSSDQPSPDLLSPRAGPSESSNASPLPKETPVPTINEHPAPAARILSATSMGTGTPRSSGEFYSMSNNSTETLVSEYVTQPPRSHERPPHLRRQSSLSSQQSRMPESLMMGYAQIQGSFTLDGSLVNPSPFEQVKRKAVVGGQGGGVVGVETKRESGLLAGFGWETISNSLGELLGGGELSSIKEMRGMASSKDIPLLSTPQSILFVEMQLAPGESKAFEYSFRLPAGLPPSHKGKAVKISYSLVIGTQRAGGAKEQQVRSVEVPFRVLGSVNSHGEILGHDLMNPYIILQDVAKVTSLSSTKPSKKEVARSRVSPPKPTINEFLTYVDELLKREDEEAGGGLLSPTAVSSSRRPSEFEEMGTAREAINMAILRSNLAGEGQQSPNRFEIARNGQRVGVVMLTRPAYRLGEVVNMVVDFANAEIPCYAVHSALETSEKVEQTLAIRSEASIHRVTRKTFVTSSEATLYSRRVVFSPTIPITATPEFVTSGVSLEWTIRLEFVVPFQEEDMQSPGQNPKPHPLLEQVARDSRGGTVLVGAEHLLCESFEVAVPLRVYGAVCTGLERLERDEALEEGLPA